MGMALCSACNKGAPAIDTMASRVRLRQLLAFVMVSAANPGPRKFSCFAVGHLKVRLPG